MSSEYLTQVELDYRKGVRNYRLLFGHPVDVVNKEFHYGVTNQIALFRPEAIFGLDLWECNEGVQEAKRVRRLPRSRRAGCVVGVCAVAQAETT